MKRRKQRAGKRPTKKPIIGFLEIEPWEEERLRREFPHSQVQFHRRKLRDHLVELRDVEILSPFIYSTINAAALAAMPHLRFIAVRGTGVDHIDLDACRRRSVQVANVPTYGANTVAEHTFALLLSLTRRIHKAYDRTIRGDFTNYGLQGIDLRGRTIGVIGTGNIGRHVVRIAYGFGMSILLSDPHPDRAFAKQYGARYVPIPRLLAMSDVVSLHAPLVPETHHLINARTIRQMKRGAILINTSRGGLVDTTALVKALATGRIGAAGLDVLEEERVIKEERELLTREFARDVDLHTLLENHMLLHFPNVLITPHIAFDSREAVERILTTTIQNIRSFLHGTPENLVGAKS